MKILFLCNDLQYFVAHRLNLAEAAKSRGWDVIICAGNYNTHINNPSLSDFKIIPIEIERHQFSLISDVNLIKEYYKLIFEIQPDIIQSITMKVNLYSALSLIGLKWLKAYTGYKYAMLFPGLGKIFEPTTSVSKLARRKFVQYVYRAIGKILSPNYIFENPYDLTNAREAGIANQQASIAVRGAGIDTSIYFKNQNASKQPIVLFASRMISEKGIGEFIQAAKTVGKKFPNIKFIAAGMVDYSNPDVFDIANIREGDLAPVRYIGNLNEEELIETLQSSLLTCLPTKLYEGFPRILLEAAFCETAMIASDQPATRQIVVPDKTGWLLHDWNNDKLTEELCAVLDQALSDPDKLLRMGNEARILGESLGADNKTVIDTIFRLYENNKS